jgi:hypothetical protein
MDSNRQKAKQTPSSYPYEFKYKLIGCHVFAEIRIAKQQIAFTKTTNKKRGYQTIPSSLFLYPHGYIGKPGEVGLETNT